MNCAEERSLEWIAVGEHYAATRPKAFDGSADELLLRVERDNDLWNSGGECEGGDSETAVEDDE